MSEIVVSARIDEGLVRQFEQMIAETGHTKSGAIKQLVRWSVQQGGLPRIKQDGSSVLVVSKEAADAS